MGVAADRRPSRTRTDAIRRWTAPVARRGVGAGLPALLAVLLAAAASPSGLPPRAAAADIFDPDAPPETRYRLAPFLTFGAEIQFSYEYRKNLALTSGTDDDASLFAPELSLAFSFDPDPRFQAYLNVAISREYVLKLEAGQSRPNEDVEFELKEAFVWVRAPHGFSVQVGRQRFEDERQWLYDAELDAVRIHYEREALAIQLSASWDGLVQKDLVSTATLDQSNTFVLDASYRLLGETTMEGYVIVRDDQAADRQRPVFVGLRSRGEPIEDLDYWLELAYVGGRDGSKRISGWGVDLGATYEFQVGPRPSLTLGFAFGSGDRTPDDDTDGSFRQTGLQENEGDFGGAADFKYYGEVLDPELSNLAILTAGVGIRPSDKFSLDLVYHYYLQHRAAATLRNAGLDAEPSGRSRRIGSGIDFVVGLQEIWDHLDALLAVGYFLPGAAFPEASGGGAWTVRAEVQFRF